MLAITYGQYLLIQLLIQTGISFIKARQKVATLTPEQVEKAILSEEDRNDLIMAEIDSH